MKQYKYNKTDGRAITKKTKDLIRKATKNVDFESLPYFITYTGLKFRHLCPRPQDICIEDIAHALSLVCRFTGHLNKHYSIAEHSIKVSELCSTEDALWGLLHDASETWLSDLSRPFKRLPGMEAYRYYEKLAMDAVCTKFGLNSKEPEAVKVIDKQVLSTERSIKSPMTAKQAEIAFLKRFYELYKLS